MLKNCFTRAAAITLACGLGLGSASAAVINHTGSFDGDGNHLYQLFDSIGADSLDTPAEVDAGQLAGDQYWGIGGGAGGSIATMIFEISAASGATSFGLFDATDPTKLVQLWTGGATPGAQVIVNILADGSVRVNFVDTGVDFAGNAFGYYINANGTMFYSDEKLNQNNADQMVAFQCSPSDVVSIPGFIAGNCTGGEYFLGFEDILTLNAAGALQGDYDYNDLVVAVESVFRVPEPATLALLGMGLVGLGALRRRRTA